MFEDERRAAQGDEFASSGSPMNIEASASATTGPSSLVRRTSAWRSSTSSSMPRTAGGHATVSRKTRQSDHTREALLSKCLHLFAARGFSSTSVDDIARAAGVTKGAIYWHFASKDEIFHAILDRIRVQWQQVVHVPVSATGDPRAQLARLFDAYADFVRQSPDSCLFLQQVVLDRQNKPFAADVARVFASTARFIARILDEGKARGVMNTGVDSVTTAHLILGMLAGASQQASTTAARWLPLLIAEAKAMTLAHISR
jgi:AcrR family transcriptional regulator